MNVTTRRGHLSRPAVRALAVCSTVVVGAFAGSPTVGEDMGGVASAPAEIRFLKGYHDGLFAFGEQTYFISQTGRCVDLKPASKTGTWQRHKGGTVSVAGGSQVVVMSSADLSATTAIRPTGNGAEIETTQSSCQAAATFLAEPGHAYEVMQHAPLAANCPMIIVDAVTRAPPAGLRTTMGQTACMDVTD